MSDRKEIVNKLEEQVNLIAEFPLVAERMRNLMDERRAADLNLAAESGVEGKSRDTMPDSLREQFRALGYLN